jgi:hypothetical protein
VAAARPVSALISAALLLLTVVAGVGEAGGFAVLGRAPAAPVTTVAAVSTIAVPVTGDRRAAPALRVHRGKLHAAGWAPLQPEPADVAATGWQPPTGLVDLAVEAGPAVVALTIEVSHRGRAPPAGSPLL